MGAGHSAATGAVATLQQPQVSETAFIYVGQLRFVTGEREDLIMIE